MWVTYFKHRSLHTYTRVARAREAVEIKRMIDLMLVKRDMLRYVQDVGAMREMRRGLPDHHDLLCKARLVGAWIKIREVVFGTRRIKSEKLKEHQYRKGYVRPLEGKELEWR